MKGGSWRLLSDKVAESVNCLYPCLSKLVATPSPKEYFIEIDSLILSRFGSGQRSPTSQKRSRGSCAIASTENSESS